MKTTEVMAGSGIERRFVKPRCRDLWKGLVRSPFERNQTPGSGFFFSGGGGEGGAFNISYISYEIGD